MSRGKTSSDESSEATSSAEQAGQLVSRARSDYHDGNWQEARLKYEDAYRRAPESESVRVAAAMGMSMLLWEQGRYAKARNYIDEALSLARELNLNESIGRLLLTLGHIEGSLGQLASAEETLDLCIDLATNQSDPTFASLCRINHRLMRKLQGKSIGPESDYREALETLKSGDNPMTVGLSLAKTAELHAKGGQADRAFQLLNSAEERYDEVGSLPAKARNRLLKARFLQDVGQWKKARGELDGLLETFRQMNSKPAMIDTLGLQGKDATHRGQYRTALEHYQDALELAQSTGSPQKLAKVQLSSCEVSARAGGTQALESCKRALQTFDKLGMPLLRARTNSAIGRNLYKQNALSEARKYFIDALRIRDEEVHPELVDDRARARDLGNLCQIEMREEITGAFHRCKETLDLLDQASFEHPRMRATSHYAAGVAAAREGHIEESLAHLDDALEGYEGLESFDAPSVTSAYLRRGSLLKRTDRPEKATETFQKGLERLEQAEGDHLASIIKLRIQYAQQQLDLDQWQGAAQQLQTLAREAREVGDIGTRAWAYSTLARARNRLDGRGEASARQALEKALPLARDAGDDELVETIESNLEAFDEEDSGDTASEKVEEQ